MDAALDRRRLAVIGHPVAHSRSPAIHTAALDALGLAEQWVYEAIDVAPEDLAERVAAMPGAGFVGANVTVPHKRAALALADTASDAAGEIGSANTLSFEGRAVGADNTDAPGFLAALPSSPEGRRALVLGAGGSARAIVWALLRGRAAVEVWNRTGERARELAAELGAKPLEVEGALPGGDYDLIVNCTSVGMESPGGSRRGSDLEALGLTPDAIGKRQVVVDLVYGATETELARTGRERGATVVDGLEVLVRQGAASFRIWTGLEPPLDVMRAAART
ncbi:MAG: shikimate dehydrogenase [Solirubrobacterales bacterium]